MIRVLAMASTAITPPIPPMIGASWVFCGGAPIIGVTDDVDEVEVEVLDVD